LVRKLIEGHTDRQTGDLISLTFLFKESRLKSVLLLVARPRMFVWYIHTIFWRLENPIFNTGRTVDYTVRTTALELLKGRHFYGMIINKYFRAELIQTTLLLYTFPKFISSFVKIGQLVHKLKGAHTHIDSMVIS
jgi:hypothetical protein